jgi:hypothetical protein
MALQRGIGKLVSAIRNKLIVKFLGSVEASRQLYEKLIQFVGTATILLGIVISAIGLYGLSSGIGVTLAVGRMISLAASLGGIITSFVGLLLLLEGIALVYVSLKLPRLVILSVILGFLSLNIPAILIGVGYSLAAGIAGIVFGYCWLVTIFVWLLRGE